MNVQKLFRSGLHRPQLHSNPMNGRKISCRLVWLLVLGLWKVPTAWAQVGGSLSGTVKDQSGGVIPGVTITATNTSIGTMFTSTTDGQGHYAFPKLPVGHYDVTVQLEGFKAQKRSD